MAMDDLRLPLLPSTAILVFMLNLLKYISQIEIQNPCR